MFLDTLEAKLVMEERVLVERLTRGGFSWDTPGSDVILAKGESSPDQFIA